MSSVEQFTVRCTRNLIRCLRVENKNCRTRSHSPVARSSCASVSNGLVDSQVRACDRDRPANEASEVADESFRLITKRRNAAAPLHLSTTSKQAYPKRCTNAFFLHEPNLPSQPTRLHAERDP